MPEPKLDDRRLTRERIQTLSSADQLADFFAYLRYPEDARLEMTPDALQLPQRLKDVTRRIERLTSVEGGALQVYLFELTSVTVAHTRVLARAFRNRAGNFLLVLTDDYERIDFVLLEREVPGLTDKGPSRRGVTVRPRVLSVKRRDPGRVALRVLRRFTFTEYDAAGRRDPVADAYGQWEKLKSAYTVAEWSEPLFNNRALFSDYYLNERLPDHPVWDAEGRNQAFRAVRKTFAGARRRFAGEDTATIRRQLIRPLLETLGFRVEAPSAGGDGGAGEREVPDFLLHADGQEEPAAFVLAYPWNRYLDGKDDKRDDERPEENPGAQVVTLLEAGAADWGIVTNGKTWRLYSSRAHSRATNTYEVNLEETLASPDPGEPFRYFYLFFRAEAFRPDPKGFSKPSGSTTSVTFLDWLMEESQTYARELGERLKERVFEEIFPHFAAGFIHSLGGPDTLRALPEEEREAELDRVYRGTLTFLYRLLFLLYAESRDLLPVREVRGYYGVSLRRLSEEIAEQAGPLEDLVPRRLEDVYPLPRPGAVIPSEAEGSREESRLYDRLLDLFRVIDAGSPARNVPTYNGGLFITDPDEDDSGREAEAARFLEETPLPDRYLALGLDRLARDVDPKRGDLGFIDYKSLGVRQLGSIYEGLLEFNIEVGESVPESNDQTSEVTLVSDKGERKATGSYYTPDYIVKYIVRHTVGPVLDEKLDALRPRLHEAEGRFRKVVKRKVELEGVTPDEPMLLQNVAGDVLHDLFDVKVLDPAMGSGHFLVEAVDYVTDRLVRFLDGFPFLGVFFEGMRRSILEEMERQKVTVDPGQLTDVTLLKRHVLKRCIYGVDLNPMAVELAKVSLWLDCFTLGAPLSFLDHHLRWGNSLVGAMAQELEEEMGSPTPDGQTTFLTGPFVGLLQATDVMQVLSRLADVTLEQVRESRSLFEDFEQQAKPFKQLLDIHVARHFGVERAQEFLTLYGAEAMDTRPEELGKPYQEVVERTRELYDEKRFFHWDLEFPEVFIDLEHAAWKEDGGFDAVVGNPPYDELSQEELGREIDERPYLEATPRFCPAMGYRINVYRLFILQALELTSDGGWQSFIVPMSLLADRFTFDLRRALLQRVSFQRIEQFPQKDDPLDRVFLPAKLSTCLYVVRQSPPRDNSVFVRTHPGRDIQPESPSYTTMQSSFFEFDPKNLSIPGVGQDAWNIVSKMATNERFQPLGDVARAVPGELMINRKFEPYLADGHTGEEIIRGAHIGMYQIVEPKQGETLYLKRAKYLSEHPGSEKALHHQDRRVVYQRYAAIDNYRRLIATILPGGYFCSHTVGYLADVEDRALGFLVCLLNSKILDWRFDLTSTNNNVNGYEVEALAIPRICFTTPEDKRERLVTDLVALEAENEYETLLVGIEEMLPQDADGEVIASQLGATDMEEKSDVVHDLLAYLAEQMIAMHEEKQERVEAFWNDLETAYESPGTFEDLNEHGKWEQSLWKDPACRPYVDKESRSTRHLDESLGWDEACFEAFAGMLAGKTSVTRPMIDVYRTHHEPYRALVERIEATDELIDQIVYRLYGLTEEEIAVVEGRTTASD